MKAGRNFSCVRWWGSGEREGGEGSTPGSERRVPEMYFVRPNVPPEVGLPSDVCIHLVCRIGLGGGGLLFFLLLPVLIY